MVTLIMSSSVMEMDMEMMKAMGGSTINMTWIAMIRPHTTAIITIRMA